MRRWGLAHTFAPVGRPTGNAVVELVSLTPPGKPAHRFTYSAVGLQTLYSPPEVGGAGPGASFSTSYACRTAPVDERLMCPEIT